jgi:hypothetical protein
MKYLVITLGTLLLSLSLITSCAKKGGIQEVQATATPKKIKVLLLWCDVTSSLKDLESEEVSSIASAVLDHFPQGTKYVLYPIQTETGRPVPIIKSGPTMEDLPTNDDTDDKSHSNVERATLIKNEITRLYKENKVKHPNDRRTCILNTLDVSAIFLSQFDDRYDPELVFVSDMIEDCRNTPLHKNVQLDKQLFSETIKLVDAFTSPPDLSRLRITIIVPTAKDTSTVPAGQRPDPRDLERFWQTVFVKCHFSRDNLSNKERFYWSPEGLPERFLAMQQ